MAVVMALQSAPIYRLQKSWAVNESPFGIVLLHDVFLSLFVQCLSKRDRATFANLIEFVSSNENWKRLRHHLSNTKLPCIPYLGRNLDKRSHSIDRRACCCCCSSRHLFD